MTAYEYFLEGFYSLPWCNLFQTILIGFSYSIYGFPLYFEKNKKLILNSDGDVLDSNGAMIDPCGTLSTPITKRGTNFN